MPLDPYKKYVTSFGDIKNDAVPTSVPIPPLLALASAGFSRDIHATLPATWLSGTKLDFSAPKPAMSATVDQVIARRIGGNTPLPSLQVASEAPIGGPANIAPFLSLSFRDATTPLPMEHNPRNLFVRLFGDVEKKDSTNENASLLDLIKEQTRALQQDLGPADRAVLDEHLTAVRAAEQRLETSKQNVFVWRYRDRLSGTSFAAAGSSPG